MEFKANTNIRLLIAAIIVIIFVLITFRGSLKNTFVDWDDYGYVVNNELVRDQGDNYVRDLFTTPVMLNYHPLTILSLRLNNNVCNSCPEGISPMPFIRGNIILHILNSLLVLILVCMLTNCNIIAALLVALIFGIHPMHVESVAWISERKDVLYSFFFLGGLITYILFLKNEGRKYLWLAVTFCLFIMSCLSKATAVVFPVVLLLLKFWFNYTDGEPVSGMLKKVFSVRNLLLLTPFFVISVLFGLMAFRIQNNENFLGMLRLDKDAIDVVNTVRPFNLLQRFQVAGYGFVMYIIRFLIPHNLSSFYPYPDLNEFTGGSFAVILWISLAVTTLTAALVLWSVKKSRLYLFGAGFFFITIVLVLQFVSIGNSMMANRYSYLPYIGLALIPAILITGLSKSARNILLAVSAIFIITMMVLSMQQVKIWKNTDTLWTSVLKKHPELELARRSRGKYYSRMSGQAKNERAKKVLEDKAFTDLSEAIKAGTESSDVYEALAIIYNSRGEPGKALLFISKAIKMNPGKGGAYYNRAMIYDQLDEKNTAIEDYTRALEYDPGLMIKILNNRSILYLESGRYAEARADLDRLISIDNSNFMYYYNRAFSRLQTGDIDGAITDYRSVLRLKPDDAEVRQQLQVLLDNHR